MKEKESRLSHDYLLQMLEYFPDTGKFFWKVNLKYHKCIGKEAGYKNSSHGRYLIRINKNRYYRSRLAWFYVHGVWPKNEIDHRNRIEDDDRIENLREATHQENSWNRIKKRKGNKLPRCIIHSRNKLKFIVVMQHENKSKNLGRFDSLNDAIKCRDDFEKIHRKFMYT